MKQMVVFLNKCDVADEEQDELDDTIELVRKLADFAWPDVRRGPADRRWVETMSEVAKVLGWGECPECQGEGCSDCLYIGAQEVEP